MYLDGVFIFKYSLSLLFSLVWEKFGFLLVSHIANPFQWNGSGRKSAEISLINGCSIYFHQQLQTGLFNALVGKKSVGDELQYHLAFGKSYGKVNERYFALITQTLICSRSFQYVFKNGLSAEQINSCVWRFPDKMKTTSTSTDFRFYGNVEIH